MAELIPGRNLQDEPALGFRELLRSVWVGRLWVIGVTVVTLALALGLTAVLRPVYESEVLLEFDDPDSSGSLLSQLSPLAQLGIGGMSTDPMETQLGVLESRRIAEAVVDSVQLHVRLLEPRMARDSVLRVVDAPRQQFGARYLLTRTGADTYSVAVEKSDRPVRVPATATVGRPFQLGEITLEILPRPAVEKEIVVEVTPYAQAVADLRDDLDVSRERGSSRLVALSYRNHDRLLAAEVPNTLSAIFAHYTYQAATGDSRRQVQVLRDQVEAYGSQLRGSEDRLRAYREQADVIDPQAQVSEQVKRLSSVLAERDGAQIERSSLSRILEEARSAVRAEDRSSAYRRLASFPPFVSNGAVQNMVESLITLENDRAELLILRRAESRDVQGIDARIQQLETQLYQFGADYLESLDTQIASANTFLGGFQTELAQVPAREVQFIRHTRETELLNEIYAYLQTRLKEAEIREATALEMVRVIDNALVPLHPSSPQPVVNLALAGFLGLMIGSGVAVGRRLTDSRVQHAEEVEAAAGVPVLEVIPTHRLVNRNGARTGRAEVPVGRLVNPLDTAQAYDSLWFSLFGSGRERFPAVVLLSSTSGNDGKSLTAVNLAASLARRNVRTALVDADLRAGVLHRLLGLSAGPGVTEVLRGSASAESALQTVDVPGLPSGSLSLLARGEQGGGSAELLDSQEMRELLARLRERFDAVLIDAAPVNQGSDGLVLRGSADAMILVAQAGTTEKQELQDASRRVRQTAGSLQGIVLTSPVGNGSVLSGIQIRRIFS